MPDSKERLDILAWAMDYRSAGGDIAPLRIEITNWTRFEGDGGDWSADLLVRFDGHEETSVELIITRLAEGYRAQVHGKDIEQWEQDFPTFHGAQLAAEIRAIVVTHQIPETAS
jgi:hypothetical protein